MNSIRSRFSVCHLQSFHSALTSLPKVVSVPAANKLRSFSSDISNDAEHEKKEIYIPRRIKRRLKEKNLNIEEFEIVPVYKDKLKPKSANTVLDDAIVDIGTDVDFPSDSKIVNAMMKDVLPRQTRPEINPKETSILLFPGQGSQFVGMGQKVLPYPGVQELYSRASEILGYDLLNICLNGPKQELDKTVHCQPAVFVTSLAAVEKLKEDIPEAHERCTTAIGFSLGEITALVYSGALSFEDGLKFVKVRAEAMQQASEVVSSGMMSVFSDHKTKLMQALKIAREYCKTELKIEEPVCSVANYLCTEVKVIAGHEEALQFIEQYGKEFGIRRTKRLPVSGAFHTVLMKEQDTLKKVQRVLKTISINKPPSVRVYSNTTGSRYSDPEKIYWALQKQIHRPVHWEQMIHKIYSRKQGMEFPNTYEVGPKAELGILLKSINLKAYSSYKNIQV